MNIIKFKIDPDKIVLTYALVGFIIAFLVSFIGIYLIFPRWILPSIFVVYHGGFWIFLGWYGSNYYKTN